MLMALLLAGYGLWAQIEDPVHWTYSSRPGVKPGEAILVLTATIDDHWHIYSQFIEEGGPIPTSFHFESSSEYTLVEGAKEISKVVKGFDNTFEMNIAWFEHQAVFEQVIRISGEKAAVKGSLEYMVCNDKQCLPPTELEFTIEARPKVAVVTTEKNPASAIAEVPAVEVTQTEEAATDVVAVDSTELLAAADPERAVEEEEVSIAASAEATPSSGSMWAIFVAGFLGGLAAFLMPCIYPMVPLTVSYFTKQSSKGSAVGKALIYGASIIVIYVAVGLLVTIIFGGDALNALSTNGVFNLLFFLLLVVFAASFFGAFELTLPSSWGTKMDAKADQGGLVGVFFMAATLSLVSFSCTGPIIGSLLVEAAAMGHYMGPAVGMLGFSAALSIPFALFALFPSWLSAMPKSGGWLNSVKVVLGFLELALALKFLSNVDLAYHWEWFDREIFLVLWIAISGLLGLYLIGKVRFVHDSEQTRIGFFRLLLAVVVFAFTFYLIPGLWGAPLKSVAAFLPPQHTQDFDLYTSGLGGGVPAVGSQPAVKRKYSELFHAPLNLQPFFDYDEGLAYAKSVGKPVMIDFTGHACVNCRKMEATVWPDPAVLNLIRNEYVLIQLYVDDKTDLPEAEQYVSEFSGKQIKTIGNKWSDFQASAFNANSQPFYVLLDSNGKLLVTPIGAEYSAVKYATYLESGLSVYKQKH